MDKRHQVFVSSTYLDLQVERQKVMHALLELDYIPSGMELFPAADDSQWAHIKRVIDSSDYYVVIMAGRYGSVGPSGKSYTQMEYEYALDRGIPTIGFIHADTGGLPDAKKDPEHEAQLGRFKEVVMNKLCKMWSSPDELAGVVSRSLIQLVSQKERPGWVRGTVLAGLEEEIVALRGKLRDAELRLGCAERDRVDTEKIIQHFSVEAYSAFDGAIRTRWSWGGVFSALASGMWDGATTNQAVTLLGSSMHSGVGPCPLLKNDVEHLIGHLRALGLVELIDSGKPIDLRRWKLTELGKTVCTQEALRTTSGTQ
jgi:hypothetical protein